MDQPDLYAHVHVHMISCACTLPCPAALLASVCLPAARFGLSNTSPSVASCAVHERARSEALAVLLQTGR